jgi:hypothetical protein
VYVVRKRPHRFRRQQGIEVVLVADVSGSIGYGINHGVIRRPPS